MRWQQLGLLENGEEFGHGNNLQGAEFRTAAQVEEVSVASDEIGPSRQETSVQ